MKTETLECLEPLLKVLRAHPALHEVRPTAFHLNGKDFIHFHEEPEAIFADVRFSKRRVRMPVSTRSEQAELLERIEQKLTSLESHSTGNKSRKLQKRKRNAKPKD